jgi:hypothetical protein
MNGRVSKLIRRAAEAESVGEPKDVARRIYRHMKWLYKRNRQGLDSTPNERMRKPAPVASGVGHITR